MKYGASSIFVVSLGRYGFIVYSVHSIGLAVGANCVWMLVFQLLGVGLQIEGLPTFGFLVSSS